jgi:cytochrome c-type biogenesis protein CcmH/NrfG
MARAATKKGSQRAKAATVAQPRRRKRQSGPKPIEQTLFFTRIRGQTRWVFMLLAIVFAISFVVAGVGSGSTGIADIFNGNTHFGRALLLVLAAILGITAIVLMLYRMIAFGIVLLLAGIGLSVAFAATHNKASASGSIAKAQKQVQQHPKSAAAYKALARAYELKGDDISAISTLEQYTGLKPKDVDALRELAGLYTTRVQKLSAATQAAQANAQTAQPSTFGPTPTSPLGKAIGAGSNPISSAAAQSANAQFNAIYSSLVTALQSEENVYARIVKLAPDDGSSLLLYAQTATYARDYKTAVSAYQTFVKKFPTDPSVPYAKQQLKTLKALAGATAATSTTKKSG